MGWYTNLMKEISKTLSPVSTAVTGESGPSSDVKTDVASVKPTVRYSRMTADDVRKYGIGMPDEEENTGSLMNFKKGGKVKSIDGIALRGKTRAKLKGK